MCVSPNLIYVDRGLHWEEVPVPCKTCWRCLSNRVNNYVGRSLCEASVSDWAVALTLTYAPRDDLADKVLTPPHFQAFPRALRRRGHSIRYLVAGEYGDKNGRAHFHCVLFGNGERPTISKKRGHKSFDLWPQQENFHDCRWPHGHIFADWTSDERAMRYVSKYVLKGKDQSEYWFSLSKKPPLGHCFFQRKALEAVELGVLPSRFEYMPPGGSSSRAYLMTGATRRDYLRTVVDGWEQHRPLERSRLNEWVLKSLEKIELAEAVNAASKHPLEVQFEALNDQLERSRPRKFKPIPHDYAVKLDTFLSMPLEED